MLSYFEFCVPGTHTWKVTSLSFALGKLFASQNITPLVIS